MEPNHDPISDHGILGDIDSAFYEDLVEKTRRYLGRGADNNEVQPESIVQSVLRSAMVKGKIQERSIEDMDQLRAFLIYKARRKIWDRRRKSRPSAASDVFASDEREGIGATGSAVEPAPEEIASAEEDQEGRVRSIASAFASMRQELSAEDWTIVKLRILDDQPWGAVAAIIGRTPGAARKHFSTSLRPRLAELLSDTVLESCE